MIHFFIILFAISLLFLSTAYRFRRLVNMIALQGILLFGIALVELHQIEIGFLIFIIAETLVVKAILIPYMLRNIIKKTKIIRVHQHALPGIYSIMFISAGILLTLGFAFIMQDKGFKTFYFATALFTLYTGLFFIISHKKIFSHLIGFLVIENAVFLLSLAVGSEMPMLINIGILLDVLVSVLILGAFVSKIGSILDDMDVEQLTSLKE